eukprot:TRINITY_DN613_c0_g1_i2.p1 TRINITY_DN613_c0_g1~~TRINITY_DN613_c0_g1_i2.p1  ORF type:complete len:229 (-),score=41.65 TRINITY_DN613_c0_g1_i2:143-829(-)
MKVISPFYRRFHLDKRHMLLTARNMQHIRQFFEILDLKGTESLDDIQFLAFMKLTTDLSEPQIYKVFDLFDVDKSGSMDFNEFYLLSCMLIAIKDKEEKQFLFRHSRTCFDLLDQDSSKSVSPQEFATFGFLFNFGAYSIRQIFREFDVSGDKELDYNEFRMFTFACIDRQRQIDEEQAKKRAKRRERQSNSNVEDEEDEVYNDYLKDTSAFSIPAWRQFTDQYCTLS